MYTKLSIFFLTLVCAPLFGILKPDFFQAMDGWVHPKQLHGEYEWKFTKNLYHNFEEAPQNSVDYIIPKIIHIIWLGSPMPERCKILADSWRKFHPSWEVKIWTDTEAASFPFINQAAFDVAKNYGEKSDIWRYELLYLYGGLYVDTDFECVSPFDDLHKSCEFYTGISQQSDPLVLWIGIIGAKPRHPILKSAIDYLRIGNGDQNSLRIMEYTGPYHFTRSFFKEAPLLPKGSVVAFPVTFFYPFPAHLRSNKKDRESCKSAFLKPESLAIHYFDTSWQTGN